MAQVLLAGGASKLAEDDSGRTPYDRICSDGFASCSNSTRAKLEFLLYPYWESARFMAFLSCASCRFYPWSGICVPDMF